VFLVAGPLELTYLPLQLFDFLHQLSKYSSPLLLFFAAFLLFNIVFRLQVLAVLFQVSLFSDKPVVLVFPKLYFSIDGVKVCSKLSLPFMFLLEFHQQSFFLTHQ
jgi:hypothetical protein